MLTNKSIFFVRHGKLLLPYKDHSEMPFGVIADLASEKLDPPIDKVFCRKLADNLSKILPLDKINNIYTSPSQRSRGSARLVARLIKNNCGKEIHITILPELKEIEFDLRRIYPLSEDSRFDIKKINKKVFEAMACGLNCESALNSYFRAQEIFSYLKNAKSDKTLLITHDFFMRILEICVKNKGKEKLSLTCEELENTQRNGYLCGFATDSSLAEIEHLKSDNN